MPDIFNEFFDKIEDIHNFPDDTVFEEFIRFEDLMPMNLRDYALGSIEKHRPQVFKKLIDRLN